MRGLPGSCRQTPATMAMPSICRQDGTGPHDEKPFALRHVAILSRWLGDLDSNQDCPGQSRKFYH